MLATLEVQMSSIESCPPCNQYCSLQHDAKSYNKLCRKQNVKNVNEYSLKIASLTMLPHLYQPVSKYLNPKHMQHPSACKHS